MMVSIPLKIGMSIMKYVDKGWGYEVWIANKSEYCGKLLFFEKGKKCSWHYHKLKDETFYLQSGKMVLLYSDKDWVTKDNFEKHADRTLLTPGMSFHIPTGRKHQMIALEDSELFEFSTEHFDEDSHRIVKGD